MLKQLFVRYEPNSIPWDAPSHLPGHQMKQQEPMKAFVVLTVHAVDEETLLPVDARVTGAINPDIVDDPNFLDFPTNVPQTLVLSQVTSHEGPGGSNFYFSPDVQVNAPGYEVFVLTLN
jgi:hypothetical protein